MKKGYQQEVSLPPEMVREIKAFEDYINTANHTNITLVAYDSKGAKQ
jgi:hypothetical protein